MYLENNKALKLVKLTTDINPGKHGFVAKTLVLIITNINEFTAFYNFFSVPDICYHKKSTSKSLFFGEVLPRST